MAKIYTGATGVEIVVDMGEDMTGATGTVLQVRMPDGTEARWQASVSGTRSLRYVTQPGDLDQDGRYLIQPHLAIGGFSGPGEPFTLAVHELFT